MKPLSTSNFSIKETICFAIVLLCIFGIFIMFFEGILYKLGETKPYDEVIIRQHRTDEYYFPRYANVRNDYKIKKLEKFPTHTIALGTSRIIQMRQSHFKGAVPFFNAATDASTGGGLNGMHGILKSLNKNQLPERIIVELDPWLFNPNYPANRPAKYQNIKNIEFFAHAKNLVRFAKSRWEMYNMLAIEEKSIVSFLFKEQTGIGLNAKLLNVGFKRDGSFTYPADREEEPQRSFEDWKKILAADQYRFASAQGLDEKAVHNFRELLKFCKQNKIEVVGIMLPFRTDFYEALMGLNSHAIFFRNFRHHLPEIMESEGFQCFDFSSPDSLNLTKEDFHDKMHTRPEVFQRITQSFGLSRTAISE